MSLTSAENLTVGGWVREHPATSRVFQKHGIDFCCGGKVDLATACAKKGLAVRQIEQELQQAVATDVSNEEDLESLSLAELSDKIVHDHHEYLRRELPRLTQMVDKVCQVHGDKYDWLAPLQTAFNSLRDELIPHMFKEENILFPAIKRIEELASVPSFPFGSIENPIHRMEHEHDHAGDLLAQIRQLTSDFTVPAEACNTFRAMLDGLRELELDMHQHVHRENNVLFVKAAELARRLS